MAGLRAARQTNIEFAYEQTLYCQGSRMDRPSIITSHCHAAEDSTTPQTAAFYGLVSCLTALLTATGFDALLSRALTLRDWVDIVPVIDVDQSSHHDVLLQLGVPLWANSWRSLAFSRPALYLEWLDGSLSFTPILERHHTDQAATSQSCAVELKLQRLFAVHAGAVDRINMDEGMNAPDATLSQFLSTPVSGPIADPMHSTLWYLFSDP
ncbi:hypothetical protein K504DRAFT_505002 [Pleomassaria siparia CBS 279.74]|uniref:Uncharacterized protein n=1 Tax=Pleomassaria siparia CBS 279.74 TaxID=1314801 RepID=A0A6G1K335_9PLEO|nr:hypothetical protein K504DRAFT_505002 [Pleomassaria siparia CBS 279.74]